MHQLSRHEKYLVHNTLNFVPLMLQNQGVLIDLRNETSVAGRIDSADGFMNIYLTEAVFIDRNGLQYPFDEFMVKNRVIRQIHLPPHMDISAEIDRFFENISKKPKRDDRSGKSLKYRRAKARHEEVLKEMAAAKKK